MITLVSTCSARMLGGAGGNNTSGAIEPGAIKWDPYCGGIKPDARIYGNFEGFALYSALFGVVIS